MKKLREIVPLKEGAWWQRGGEHTKKAREAMKARKSARHAQMKRGDAKRKEAESKKDKK